MIEHWQLDPTDWPHVKVTRLKDVRLADNQKGGGMTREEFQEIVTDRFARRMALYEGKSHDYATKENMLGNFERTEKAADVLRMDKLPSPLPGPFRLILLKLDRWINLLITRDMPQNESIDDTLMDLQNYIDLADAVWRNLTKEEHEVTGENL